jgi:hypothetical protein
MAGDAAGRRSINSAVGVAAATWALGSATFDVGVHSGVVSGGASALLILQGPLFLRAVNLAEVVHASILLRGATGFHEVRDRDRGQQTNDGNDDHDFHELETGFTIRFNLHVQFSFLVFPVVDWQAAVIISPIFRPHIAALPTDCHPE